jgi:hypothetical protein
VWTGTGSKLSSSNWIFGNGIYYGGGCSYFFQPGCTYQDVGAGTLNVVAIYKNGTAHTNPDYVLEKHHTGEIERFKDSPGEIELNKRNGFGGRKPAWPTGGAGFSAGLNLRSDCLAARRGDGGAGGVPGGISYLKRNREGQHRLSPPDGKASSPHPCLPSGTAPFMPRSVGFPHAHFRFPAP